MRPLSSCWCRSSGSFIRGTLPDQKWSKEQKTCLWHSWNRSGNLSRSSFHHSSGNFVWSHQVIKVMSLIRMWQKDLCQYCQKAARDYSQIFNGFRKERCHRSQIPNSQLRLNCQYPVFILVLTELPAASFLKGHTFIKKGHSKELGLNHFQVNTCVCLSSWFFLRLFAQWPFQLVRKNSFWFIPMEWVRLAGTPTKEPWKVNGLSRVDFPHAVTFDLQGEGKKNPLPSAVRSSGL